MGARGKLRPRAHDATVALMAVIFLCLIVTLVENHLVSVVVVVGLLAIVLIPSLCFNAQLVESDSTGRYYSETRRGRTIKRYLLETNWSGDCIVTLPDYADPFSIQHKYSIVRKQRLLGRTDNLIIVWRNLVIYECTAQNICDIKIQEMLAESVNVILKDVLDEEEIYASLNKNRIRAFP